MRTSACVIAIGALAGAIGGCSQYREQVRDEAHGRVALVQAQLHYDQAEHAFATGQFEKAMREVEVALATYPDSPDYHLLQGRIYLETHRLESAKRSFDKVLELDPERADGHYFSAILLQRWSKHDEATASYLRAFELAPEDVHYLAAAAESMITVQRYDEAERLLETHLAYFEHNPALPQLLGQIAMLQDNPDAAAEHFEKARLLNPDDVSLLQELARAQFAAGHYVRCHETVKRIQTMNPDRQANAQWSLLEARCLAMTDRLADARNVYLKLTELTPADPSVWIELGNVAFELGDFRRVAFCGERLVALAPNRAEGYLLKGLNEREQGRIDAAITLFEQAADRSPAAAWPHVILGMTLETSGDRSGALAAYGRALRAEPDHPHALTLFRRLDGAAVAAEPEDRVR